MGGDPNMEQDPNAMGGDPNMEQDPNAMGGDPNMEQDPNAMGGDPNMEQDPNAADGNLGDVDINGGQEEVGDDSTMSIINQLSPADKDAVRAYAESMLSRDETKIEQGAPMQESFVFTKKQLMENFGPTQDELNKKSENVGLEKKVSKKTYKKSPFNSPFK